jgi:hypothetical protein
MRESRIISGDNVAVSLRFVEGFLQDSYDHLSISGFDGLRDEKMPVASSVEPI